MNKMKELTLVIPAKEEEDSLPLVLNEISSPINKPSSEKSNFLFIILIIDNVGR